MPAELEIPELPTCVASLWETFLALHAARGSNGFGPAPIGYGALLDYARCMGLRFSAWEVSVLMAMDVAARSAMAKG